MERMIVPVGGVDARRRALEELYSRYNRREQVRDDPIGFLYRYKDPRDREIVGLIASALAYGRVVQIHRSVSLVLERMPRPALYLAGASRPSLRRAFGDFVHRFTTGEDLASLLYGIKLLVGSHGSLRACFAGCDGEDSETVVPALAVFADRLKEAADGGAGFLVPSPDKGSACKRLNLYLRWMVRRDEVDPGGWDDVPAGKLVVPLDTHMYRICTGLKFTRRKQADLRAALEITAAFRAIAPEDPVKYDFSLTRLGMRGGALAELESRFQRG